MNENQRSAKNKFDRMLRKLAGECLDLYLCLGYIEALHVVQHICPEAYKASTIWDKILTQNVFLLALGVQRAIDTNKGATTIDKLLRSAEANSNVFLWANKEVPLRMPETINGFRNHLNSLPGLEVFKTFRDKFLSHNDPESDLAAYGGAIAPVSILNAKTHIAFMDDVITHMIQEVTGEKVDLRARYKTGVIEILEVMTRSITGFERIPRSQWETEQLSKLEVLTRLEFKLSILTDSDL